MKYARRLAALFLSTVLALSAGCAHFPSSEGSGESGARESSVPAPADSSEVSSPEESSAPVAAEPEPYTLPLTRQRQVLRIFLPGEASTVSALAENGLLSDFALKSRIFTEFVYAEEGSAAEALTSFMASADAPDIIYSVGLLGVSLDTLVFNNRILRLNELIDQYGYHLYHAFKDDPSFYRQVLTCEKNIAVYPYSHADVVTRYGEDFFFRADWLDALGLSVPTTPDGWQTVLTSLKNGDPNGNGYADEIPFVDASGRGGVLRLSTLFGFNANPESGWACSVLEGRVTFAAFAQEFPRFISTVSQWYADGLIQESFGEMSFESLSSRFTGNTAGVFFGTVKDAESILGSYNYESGSSGFGLVPAPAAVLTGGSSFDYFSSPAYDGDGAAVSGSCELVKEAVRFLDYLYGPEGRLLLSYGLEDSTFTYDSTGSPMFTDLITNGDGYSYAEALQRYTLIDSGLRLATDELYMSIRVPGDTANRVYNALSAASTDSQLPESLPFSDVEQTRLSSLMQDIEPVYSETVLRLIKGDEEVSVSDLRSQLTSMGIDEVVRILQRAYERMNA